MTATETIPTTWDDSRDNAFFRITAHLLDARTVEAATCLLAANDWQERDQHRLGRRADRNVELLLPAPAFLG